MSNVLEFSINHRPSTHDILRKKKYQCYSLGYSFWGNALFSTLICIPLTTMVFIGTKANYMSSLLIMSSLMTAITFLTCNSLKKEITLLESKLNSSINDNVESQDVQDFSNVA